MKTRHGQKLINLPGLNIQWPISNSILTLNKKIETRTYNLPQKYIQKSLALIETPGPHGNFKARAVAIIVFNRTFRYESAFEFYKDEPRHLVCKKSRWAWNAKKPKKWGWQISKVHLIAPQEINKPRGIVFTTEVTIAVPVKLLPLLRL